MSVPRLAMNTCMRCGQSLGHVSIIELDGNSHPKCWKDWAKNDPQYQKDLASYKAKGKHVDYWMLDPDLIDDEGRVIKT